MILTFQTDILTFQTNFFRSDYCVMSFEFRDQKVWSFPLIPRGPHTNKHYYRTEMTEQLNPRNNFKNFWFRLNVARATRNTFAGHVFVTSGIDDGASHCNSAVCAMEL